jgi:quercetin dioxygenase-like cupin family protein
VELKCFRYSPTLLHLQCLFHLQIVDGERMVRVLKVVSNPGDVAKMHYHPDHVVYAMKGGKVALTSGGKTLS